MVSPTLHSIQSDWNSLSSSHFSFKSSTFYLLFLQLRGIICVDATCKLENPLIEERKTLGNHFFSHLILIQCPSSGSKYQTLRLKNKCANTHTHTHTDKGTARNMKNTYSGVEFLGLFQMSSFQLWISLLIANCCKVVPVTLSIWEHVHEMNYCGKW